MSTRPAATKGTRTTVAHEAPARTRRALAKVQVPLDVSFAEVLGFIAQAREQASQAVNTAMVDLYWRLGEYLHHKIEADGWAKSTVLHLAAYIARSEPGTRGFSAQNLWRMRQFFQTYRDDPRLSPMVRVLPWTHNLIILTQAKRPEEREFYLRMAVQQRWAKRELERQFRLGAFEQAVLAPPKLSPAVREIHGDRAVGAFKDVYGLEFLGLPTPHSEADLHRGLLAQLRSFLIELGRDFCFVGTEFMLQVGGRDFALDCSDLRVIPIPLMFAA
jgi:predicted nuclease of restriction endonuclease-like (RecB) superfamily